jgi:hypothetical protein
MIPMMVMTMMMMTGLVPVVTAMVMMIQIDSLYPYKAAREGYAS